jgi:small-conductance mechanosensitive channel
MLFLALGFAWITKATGQTPSPALPTSEGRPATSSASPSSPSAPKVIGVEGNLELDDIIKVEVDHLKEWTTQNDPSKLVPYINGLAIRGNYPEEIHASTNHLHFHLQVTPQNQKTWVDVLGEPHATRKTVTFSVGLENQTPFNSEFDQTNPLLLTVISPVYGIIALVVVVLTLILLVWLARKTNLIRDGGECPVPGKLRPYNLGRTQMAFWFFLIYASYVTIWLITNALDTITGSLLALMGISAATALSEAMIDSGKTSASSGQLQTLSAEKQSLEQTIPAIQTQIDARNAKGTLLPEDTSNRDSLNKQAQDSRARLALVNQQLQSLTPAADAGISKGFLRDILSDASGYSFHRFQIFAWTIVLGIIFVSSVYNNLTMPEFSATLLGLMGISSGTYIGFKFPETK